MNKVILAGRLVRDPEVRYTQTGKVTEVIAHEIEFMGSKPINNVQTPPQAKSFGSEVPCDEEIPF